MAAQSISSNRLATSLVSLLLLAAACSQASEPTTAPSGAADTATTAPASTSGLTPVGSDTPGVTDDTITISFIITDATKVANAFGWELPDEGDRSAQINAVVDAVNDQGGIAGRMVDPRIHLFDAITDGPVAEEALCNAITQDDKAFAVVMTGQFQDNARPCYAAANTMILDATLYPLDQTAFDELAPYLWSPFLPTYENLVSGLTSSLLDSGWFDGATLGVIAIESDLGQRAYTEQIRPALEAAGVEVASYNTIDPTDGTAFNNDQLQAIVNFKEAGVDKVLAIGGSRLVAWFIDTSRTQNFAPAFALTSYDSPEFNVFNYPENLAGAAGISVLPGFDVNDGQWAFPASPAEQECIEIFSNAGLVVETRSSIRTGLMFCDSVRLLAAAGAGAGEVSARGMADAVWDLGDAFVPASVYGVEFDHGVYAGGSNYLPFTFDASCECMSVTGEPKAFDG